MAELVIGFSGLLGDFRSVFIVLFISALAVRIRWTAITSIVVAAAAILLVILALFWTSVKAEYREVATGSTIRRTSRCRWTRASAISAAAWPRLATSTGAWPPTRC